MITHLKDRLTKNPPKNGKYYLVVIDGRGGAGKTTLAKYVEELLPNYIVINGDDYFEPDDATIAFGSFNDERFAKDVIKPLQGGATSLLYRPYDWHTEPHITEKELEITKGVILERNFSFAFELDYDLKIWVQAPAQLALQRGQERDEMPLDEGLKQWEEVWQPQEDTHFEKVKPLETADIVIDGTQPFEDQLV